MTIAIAGPSYKPPTRDAMSRTLLDAAYERMHTRMREKIEPLARLYGLALVSDGATAVDRTPLLNLLRAAHGVVEFVKAKDCAGEVKNTQYIADFVVDYVKAMQEPRQVVSVVMNNATRSSWPLIERACPWIVCVPCVPHCCDLELEDFAKKVPFIKDVIQRAVALIKFILNHQHVLAEYKGESLSEGLHLSFHITYKC